MRRATGRYYLGRVHMLGRLREGDLFVRTIEHPATVHGSRYAWTVTDADVCRDGGRCVYAFGKLSKYLPEGSVTVVDESLRSQDQRPEPNLLVATSPFIYLPEFSGIAYLHVWNQIETKAFVRRFCQVIHESHGSFFVTCEIEPISDLRSFVAKLRSIASFLEISAQVHPPNPLFGRAWRELREYIQRRRADELKLREKSSDGGELVTQLVEHVEGLLSQTEAQPYEPQRPIDITDAALLMAADGYGKGKIIGQEGESRIIVRTTDTQSSFVFAKEPGPQELYEEARRRLAAINQERSLDHGE